jgi:hypothetical protein
MIQTCEDDPNFANPNSAEPQRAATALSSSDSLAQSQANSKTPRAVISPPSCVSIRFYFNRSRHPQPNCLQVAII